MFFVEDKNFLSNDHIDKIQSILKGGDVPFYMSLEAAKPNDGGINFVHHIIHRDSPDKINSPLYELFVSILNSFCDKNNIKYSKIHRCAINITINNGVLDRCPTHEDHFFPHNQLIIYLNESDGDTIILNKLGKELQVSKPEIYKGIAFNNLPHYHYFPKKGIRAVAVITFS